MSQIGGNRIVLFREHTGEQMTQKTVSFPDALL